MPEVGISDVLNVNTIFAAPPSERSASRNEFSAGLQIARFAFFFLHVTQ